MSKRIEYRVIRDSDNLGLDRGMRCYVVPGSTRGGKMDLDVPALDMRIAGVAIAHPDLALVK